jgi:hypothetical protein
LLSNGGFESDLAGWNSCGGSGQIVTDSSVGSKALLVNGGSCIYQEFPITAGTEYKLQCQAKTDGYTSITLTAMNQSYAELTSDSVEVNSSGYQSYPIFLTVPSNSAIGAVTFYSDGNGKYDDCSVVVTN